MAFDERDYADLKNIVSSRQRSSTCAIIVSNSTNLVSPIV
jgi:hypothetical protein